MSGSSTPISFATGINTQGFDRGIASILSSVQSLEQGINKQMGSAVASINSVENSLKKMGAAVGIAFSFNEAISFVNHIRDVRAEIQSLEISFETLLGSKTRADALFGSIRQFAVNTPMQLKDLASAAQLLLSFNIEESKIMPYLQALGDVSMGDTQKFQSLSLAFAQMSSAGKLMGQDLMQMINAGFNPLAQMAEKTGKSINELKDEMSAGKISAEMVQQAFIDATSAGGKFYGMLEKQSKGIAGAMSNLQGAIDDMFNEMGEATEGIMADMYGMATAMVKDWKAIAVAITSAAAAYGMFKAAMMADTAIKTTIGAAQYDAEVEALTRVVAAKEAGANADVEAALASGKLTAAKAEQIIALRAEAESVVESLRAKAKQAAADLAAAEAAEKSAKKRFDASVQNLKAAEAQLVAAQKSGDQAAISAAQAKVDAAAQKHDAAAKELNAAAADTKAKKEASSAAATTAETAATELDTAAQNGNTVATTRLAAAKSKLLAALRKVYATMMANPYMLAAAAVAALAYGIYKLCTAQTASEKAQKKLNEAFAKSEAEAKSEMATVNSLFSALKSAKEGTIQYKTIKDQIISQYGQYLKGLVDEENRLLNVEAAYKKVAEAARLAARERAIEAATKAAQDSFQEETEDAYNQIYEKLKKKGELGKAIYDMIKWDLEQSGKLSEETIGQINSLYGVIKKEKTKDGKLKVTKTTSRELTDLNKEIRRITDAQNTLDRAITETQERYGSVANDFMEYDISSIKTEREALKYAIEHNQAKDHEIYIDGLLVQKINNVADAKLALFKMDAAIAAKADETHKTELDNFKEKQQAYYTALATVRDIKANMAKYDKGALEKANKALEEAKKAYIKVGGDPSGKGANAGYQADATSESLRTIENKQARERQRFFQDMELELWQARIDAGEYGNQKYIQQQELDFRKEQLQLQRQMEQEITAEIARQKAIWDKKEELAEKEAKARGGSYTRKAFNSDSLSAMEFTPGTTFSDAQIGDVEMADIYAISQRYAEMMKGLIATQDYARGQQRKQEKEDMDEYLAQWGTYEQKRQAITDMANKKMSEAATIGQRESIAAQLKKDLGDLRAEDLKKSLNWDAIFGDTASQSIETLRHNLDKLRRAFEANKSAMSATEIKDYMEGINRLEDEISSRNPFVALHKSITDISKSKGEFITACNEFTAAQERQTAAQLAYDMAVDMQNKLAPTEDEDGNKTEETEEYRTAVQATADAQDRLRKAEENAAHAEQNMLNKRNDITKAYSKFANSLRAAGQMVTSLGGRASALAQVFSDDLAASIDKVLGFTDEIFEATSTIIDATKDLGEDVVKQIGNTVEKTSEGVQTAAVASTNAIKTVEKASAILAIIGAALQIATAIANLFNDDEEKQKEIEKLQRRIDQLQWELDNADIMKMQENRGKAIDKLREIYADCTDQVLALHGIQANVPSWVKGIGSAIYQSEIYAQTVEKIVDEYANLDYTVNKALGADKFNNSRKQLENLAEQQVLAMEQIEKEKSKKKTNWDEVQDLQQKIEELGQQMVEVINGMMEEIIGYTAEDLASQLGDAFVEAAKQGEDAMEAWHKKVNEIVADIIKRMLITEWLEPEIGKVFNNYRDRWFDKDGNFNGIETVNDSMTDFANDLNDVSDKFQQIWDALPDDLKKILSDEAEAFTQESGSNGGFQSMSEDTGQELNGRFTAMQIAMEGVRSLSDGIKIDTAVISDNVSMLRIGMDEMQNIALLQLGQLESINKNTQELSGMSQTLEKIEKGIKNL